MHGPLNDINILGFMRHTACGIAKDTVHSHISIPGLSAEINIPTLAYDMNATTAGLSAAHALNTWFTCFECSSALKL